MLNQTRKRFYKLAAAAQAEDGFAVQLDGRSIRTPAGKPLRLPTLALAEAIAAEWEAQGEEIHPTSMPMMSLASTAIDRIAPDRVAIIEQMVNYAATDLLCYRTASPAELVERQTQGWQPILDWAACDLGAPLTATCGIIAVDQPSASMARLKERLEAYDQWRLAAISSATAALGSLVLALALAEGRLAGSDAFALSILDDTFQIEQWGDDAEAADRRSRLQGDVLAAERLLVLVSGA